MKRVAAISSRLLSMTARAVIAAVFCLAVGGLCLATGDSRNIDSREPGLTLLWPGNVGIWKGSPDEVSRAELQLLPEDTEFAKMSYARGHGLWQESVHCSMVLSGKDRTSIHRPEVCLNAQGWNIDATSQQSIKLSNEIELSVRRLDISRDINGMRRRALYYYWFVSNAGTTSDHLERILLTARDNVFHRYNPRWSYVSVMASVSEDQRKHGGQSSDEAAKMIEGFIARVTPAFQNVYATRGLVN